MEEPASCRQDALGDVPEIASSLARVAVLGRVPRVGEVRAGQQVGVLDGPSLVDSRPLRPTCAEPSPERLVAVAQVTPQVPVQTACASTRPDP